MACSNQTQPQKSSVLPPKTKTSTIPYVEYDEEDKVQRPHLYRTSIQESRYQSTAKSLAVVAAVSAAIFAATIAKGGEGDITIAATVAVKEGFTNMGIVGGLAGSFEGAIDLGSVFAYGEGLIRDFEAGRSRQAHIPMLKRFQPQ